jgi:predicted dehydrogenase
MASTCVLHWPHRIGLHLFGEGLAIELSEFEIMVDVGQGRPVQKAEGDPFVREDRDFIDAVQGKPNRIRAPYHEALKTHQLVTTAAQAARTGQVLDLAAGAAPAATGEGMSRG